MILFYISNTSNNLWGKLCYNLQKFPALRQLLWLKWFAIHSNFCCTTKGISSVRLQVVERYTHLLMSVDCSDEEKGYLKVASTKKACMLMVLAETNLANGARNWATCGIITLWIITPCPPKCTLSKSWWCDYWMNVEDLLEKILFKAR